VLELKMRISEFVFGEDPTVEESPFRTMSAGVSTGTSAAQGPTLFEVAIPPGPVAMIATKQPLLHPKTRASQEAERAVGTDLPDANHG
jgi:hypothetical protein